MAAYYSGPRVRLPSNRSLQLSEPSSSSPLASPPAPAPVLIFPAPSSEPASPHPSGFHPRARTSSSLAYGPLRLRHVRVDSNASSASLVVCSSATDLSSPLSANSPRLARSPLQSASEWEDLEGVSGPSTASMAPSPLTRERIVRLGSARMIPRSGSGSAETPSVEMWEWTSTGSEAEPDRGLWGEDETHYEDALSQFHFPTLDESRCARVGAGPTGVGGAEADRRAGAVFSTECARPTHPSLGQRAMHLPFRVLLETVLGISPATLMLVERGCHEQTGLFGVASTSAALNAGENEDEMRPRVCLELEAARSVQRGLDALASEGLPLPLGLSICVLTWIPRRVWAAVPAMPKWR
ncbi:hypothetical protein FS749_002291 [Ceratobasidium sp. UAMH 11750]|nr:hypothetical protein FS749_002291 [Ceratobasidium sp. UAMH 11750]